MDHDSYDSSDDDDYLFFNSGKIPQFVENLIRDTETCGYQKKYQKIMEALRNPSVSKSDKVEYVYRHLVPWLTRLANAKYLSDFETFKIIGKDLELLVDISSETPKRIFLEMVKTAYHYQEKHGRTSEPRQELMLVIKRIGESLDLSAAVSVDFIFNFIFIDFDIDYEELKERVLQKYKENDENKYRYFKILERSRLEKNERHVVMEAIIKDMELGHIGLHEKLKKLGMWNNKVMCRRDLALRVWKGCMKCVSEEHLCCSYLTSEIIPELFVFLSDKEDFSQDTAVLKTLLEIVDRNWAHRVEKFKPVVLESLTSSMPEESSSVKFHTLDFSWTKQLPTDCVIELRFEDGEAHDEYHEGHNEDEQVHEKDYENHDEDHKGHDGDHEGHDEDHKNEYKGYSFVLSSVSEMLRVALFGQFKEAKDKRVKFCDSNPSLVKTLLESFYTGELSIENRSMEEIKEILRIIDKLVISSCDIKVIQSYLLDLYINGEYDTRKHILEIASEYKFNDLLIEIIHLKCQNNHEY